MRDNDPDLADCRDRNDRVPLGSAVGVTPGLARGVMLSAATVDLRPTLFGAPTGVSAHVDTFTHDNLPPRSMWPRMDYSAVPELAAIPAQVNCAAMLDRQATEFPDRAALYSGDAPGNDAAAPTAPGSELGRRLAWTYGDLLKQANRIANVLVEELDVRPGNRVLLRGPNDPMLVACWFAVIKVGGVAVATMPLLRCRELGYIAEKARIELALCDSRSRGEMEKLLADSATLRRAVMFNGAVQESAPGRGADQLEGGPIGSIESAATGSIESAATGSGENVANGSRENGATGSGENGATENLEKLVEQASERFANVATAADDVCMIAFTSGTTGRPKGTMHFHRDVLAACECFPRSVLNSGPEDVFCGSPPIAFTFGLGGLVLFPVHAGASSALLERATPQAMLQAVERFKVTTLFTAPTAYRAMLPELESHDLSSLRACVSAGEPLPLTTWEAWRQATGVPIIDGIGTTEMIHIFISAPKDEIRPGATGRPIPGYEAMVVDENMAPLPPGEVGRLAVRGPTGCRYLADERQSDYVVDGWNLTGDAYILDEDGYFWFQARADDMIISSGYNIAGPEVEEVLLAHEAVAECAVVGVPDEERGQLVKAFVVLRKGIAADPGLVKELQEFAKQRIAPYKYPRAIEFLEVLPRTDTGKVQRFKLRNAFSRATGPGSTGAG